MTITKHAMTTTAIPMMCSDMGIAHQWKVIILILAADGPKTPIPMATTPPPQGAQLMVTLGHLTQPDTQMAQVILGEQILMETPSVLIVILLVTAIKVCICSYVQMTTTKKTTSY